MKKINMISACHLLLPQRATFAALLLLIFLAPVAFAQRETPPPPAAPRSPQFPKPGQRTLPNGLGLIVIERAGVPLVSAQMVIKNGGEVDPAELSGLAEMTATLLTKGTETRTAPQIAEAIEALGGTITSDARWDASTAGVNVMTPKVREAMTILADVVRRPVFSEGEIERIRAQMLDGLQIEMSEPRAIARYVASRVVFGDAPYGHPLSGTPESLPRIKQADIKRLHSTYYRPDNAVLVIGGGIKADDAFKLAEQLFGDWAKPSAALPVSSTTTMQTDATKNTAANKAARVLVIDKPDAGQAAVLIARSGLKRTDPEYFQAIVANSVLGGGYSARLNQEIRIKRGLSYGAGSNLDVRRDTGPFIASTQTKNESGAEVATLLLGELGRLGSEAVNDIELTPRKAALSGTFARNLETIDGLVAQVASLALYGLSLDEINTYINRVQSVTAADIQKFAGARLDARSANIIIVGNAKLFIDSLRKQFPQVEVVSAAELDLNRASLRKEAVKN